MYDLVLKNCKIVNENKIYESDIAINGSRIELISNSIDAESKKEINLNGRYIIPGLIAVSYTHLTLPTILLV